MKLQAKLNEKREKEMKKEDYEKNKKYEDKREEFLRYATWMKYEDLEIINKI